MKGDPSVIDRIALKDVAVCFILARIWSRFPEYVVMLYVMRRDYQALKAIITAFIDMNTI